MISNPHQMDELFSAVSMASNKDKIETTRRDNLINENNLIMTH